jgi:SAM-dependent methyltransferase
MQNDELRSACVEGDHRGLLARLREGCAALDRDFDELYPLPLRSVSSSFWTPIAVARRVSELLVSDASTRVLDVGSGVGKFCIVGAALKRARFTGVEHREHFVSVAREAADRVGVDGAHFIHGTFESLDVTSFDAIYFFNPFEENLWGFRGHLDDTVELSHRRFEADIARAERLLAAARVGTRVVTYHGFGGEMPPSYRLVLRERQGSGHVELWTKTDPTSEHAIRSSGST